MGALHRFNLENPAQTLVQPVVVPLRKASDCVRSNHSNQVIRPGLRAMQQDVTHRVVPYCELCCKLVPFLLVHRPHLPPSDTDSHIRSMGTQQKSLKR